MNNYIIKVRSTKEKIYEIDAEDDYQAISEVMDYFLYEDDFTDDVSINIIAKNDDFTDEFIETL